MAQVFIPRHLQHLTDNQSLCHVDGTTVGEVLDALDQQFPGFRQALCQDDRLRPGLQVSVDGRIGSRGLLERVPDSGELHFLPAIGGG